MFCGSGKVIALIMLPSFPRNWPRLSTQVSLLEGSASVGRGAGVFLCLGSGSGSANEGRGSGWSDDGGRRLPGAGGPWGKVTGARSFATGSFFFGGGACRFVADTDRFLNPGSLDICVGLHLFVREPGLIFRVRYDEVVIHLVVSKVSWALGRR